MKIAKDAGQEVPDWLLKFEKNKSAKLWNAAALEKASALLK